MSLVRTCDRVHSGDLDANQEHGGTRLGAVPGRSRRRQRAGKRATFGFELGPQHIPEPFSSHIAMHAHTHVHVDAEMEI